MCSTGLFADHSEHCFDDGILMIFGYHLPFDLAMWTIGYASVQAIKNAEKDSDCSGDENATEDQPMKSVEPRAVINVIKNVLNPVVAAMFIGMVIGLTPMLHSMFFTRGGRLHFLGDSLKRLGEAVPVISLQILTTTLGGATRRFIEILRAQRKVCDDPVSSLPVSEHAGSFKLASHGSWMASVIFGKLVLLPAFGFLIFAAFGRAQRSIEQPPLVLNHETGAALAARSAIPGDFMASAVGAFLWPDDKLFRAIVVMQWSAPSCLTLIVLCHRVGLDQNTVQAVAALYLIMYALAATATTFWVTIGLAIF
jgi:predicted permease